MAPIIAGYIRVSTEMQIDKDSIVNQEDRIKEFAKSRDRECRIYKDSGISAKDQERPAFKSMLEAIEFGQIDTVVVTKLDRITRSLKDLLFLKDFFEQHSVAFIALTQNLDTATPMGRFSFYVLGLVAQLEREVTAERVAEVMRSRAHKKKWNGGVIPFGFTSQKRLYNEWFFEYAKNNSGIDLEDKQKLKRHLQELKQDQTLRSQAQAFAEKQIPDSKELIIDQKEAKVVKQIYDYYLSCKSFRGVTHRLNSNGFRTRKGVTWAGTSIRRILQNPNYYGALTYNKRRIKGKTSTPRPKEEHIIVEGVFEPIISKETFDEVQAIIEQQKPIAPRAKSSPYLLTGLVRCGYCNSRMYGYTNEDRRKPGRIYRYYRCNGHAHKGNAVCKGNTIDLKFLETSLINELKEFKLKPEKLKSRVAEHNSNFADDFYPLQEQQSQLQSNIQALEKKVMRLFSLYEDELIDKVQFKERKVLLDEQRITLETELKIVTAKLAASDNNCLDFEKTIVQLTDLADVYDALEFPDQRELLRTVLGDIVIGDKHIDYSIYAFNEVFVTSDHTGRDSSPQPT